MCPPAEVSDAVNVSTVARSIPQLEHFKHQNQPHPKHKWRFVSQNETIDPRNSQVDDNSKRQMIVAKPAHNTVEKIG